MEFEYSLCHLEAKYFWVKWLEFIYKTGTQFQFYGIIIVDNNVDDVH